MVSPSTAGFAWGGGGTFTTQLAVNDTLVVAAFQSSGGSLNLFGLAGNQASSVTITRLSE